MTKQMEWGSLKNENIIFSNLRNILIAIHNYSESIGKKEDIIIHSFFFDIFLRLQETNDINMATVDNSFHISVE